MNDRIDPVAARAHYRRFVRDGRALLTGHSHQAWPDVARDAMADAYDDAAEHVDDKWERASQVADAVRTGIAARLGSDRPDDIALAGNTHELGARFLSALPWATRRHLVTTTGEFHTLHRQLRRLAEEGVAVDFVPARPVATLAARMAERVRGDTAAVLISTVMFETSEVVPELGALVAAARAKGAEVLLDAYHAFNVVPLSRDDYGDAFVVGGGYKYAQYGEGVCFMAVPRGCALRPVYTGWFADFAHLADRRADAPVAYGRDGAARFAGATYDPVSHYRALAVQRFFDAQGWSVARLRALSLRQTGALLDALDARGWSAATPRHDGRGGFVAVPVANPDAVVSALRRDGVFVDARGDLVRLGPAPYVTDDELAAAVARFAAHAKPL